MAEEVPTIEAQLEVPSVAMSNAETVRIVGEYMRTIRDTQGDPKLWEIAEKLGWTVPQLQQFREDNEALLAIDSELALAAPPPPVIPPTDGDILLQQEVEVQPPTEEEMALAVQEADNKLAKGLRRLGLTEKEVEAAEALQAFNQGHFRESMDIVSTTVLRTDLKCVLQQDFITERLAYVRARIVEYGEFISEDRAAWVKEERLLMQQFLELGQLTVNIQETWYKGAAHLALMRMRFGRGNGSPSMTQRTNKPGFRPAT